MRRGQVEDGNGGAVDPVGRRWTTSCGCEQPGRGARLRIEMARRKRVEAVFAACFALTNPASNSVSRHRHSGRGGSVSRPILAPKNADPAGGGGHWSGRQSRQAGRWKVGAMRSFASLPRSVHRRPIPACLCRLHPATGHSTLRPGKFPLACCHSSRNKFPRPAGASWHFAPTGEPPAFAVFSLVTSQGWSGDEQHRRLQNGYHPWRFHQIR